MNYRQTAYFPGPISSKTVHLKGLALRFIGRVIICKVGTYI